MLLRVLYFGALRETLGVEQEEVEVPEGSTLADLLAQLRRRGAIWETACGVHGSLRAAIDKEFADLDAPLTDNCEVALFPPVTGG